MRKLAIIAAVLAQVAVLAYMVWGRETIINHGTRIVLDTAPIDPRDPFRGDFVRLEYAMNTLALAPVRWTPEHYEPQVNDTVYAVHALGDGGVHELQYFTNVIPDSSTDAEQIAIRGRFSQYQSVSNETTWYLRYGIEQLFVEQGAGITIEQRRGIRGGMQNPMHVNISVGKQGVAVIRDFNWGPLAIELEITDNFAIQTTNEQSAVSTTEAGLEDKIGIDSNTPAIRVHIQNLSDEPVRLNNPGNNCGFALQPVLKTRSAFEAADASCAEFTSISPVTLAPQQILSFDVDLANPRWHIRARTPQETPAPSSDARLLPSAVNESFRIVYRSDAQPGSADAADLWRGNLQSQAFTPAGRID